MVGLMYVGLEWFETKALRMAVARNDVKNVHLMVDEMSHSKIEWKTNTTKYLVTGYLIDNNQSVPVRNVALKGKNLGLTKRNYRIWETFEFMRN